MNPLEPESKKLQHFSVHTKPLEKMSRIDREERRREGTEARAGPHRGESELCDPAAQLLDLRRQSAGILTTPS